MNKPKTKKRKLDDEDELNWDHLDRAEENNMEELEESLA